MPRPITLSDEEVRLLRRALDNYLPELDYEVARIKLERERHEILGFDEALHALRDRLG